MQPGSSFLVGEPALEERVADHLVNLHGRLRFFLTLHADRAMRIAAMAGQEHMAFDLPLSSGWVLVERQSVTVQRSVAPGWETSRFAALEQDVEIQHIARRSTFWSNSDAAAEKLTRGLLRGDRSAARQLINLAPLIDTIVYSFAMCLTELLGAIRPKIIAAMREQRVSDPLFARYWPIAGMLGRAILIATTPGSSAWLVDMAHSFEWTSWTPSFALTRERNLWLGAVAARAAAETGPLVLPQYRDALLRSRHPLTAADAILGVTAIAMRHHDQKEEVREMLKGVFSRHLKEDLIAPEIFTLLYAQAETMLSGGASLSPERIFVLPSYKVDPLSFDMVRAYPLFEQVPAALATPAWSLIPPASASHVLPGRHGAVGMFARAWGLDRDTTRETPTMH